MRRFWTTVVLCAASIGHASCDEVKPGGSWVKLDENRTGARDGSALLCAPDSQRMLLVGPAKDAPFIQAFDPAAGTWSSIAPAGPRPKGDTYPYYQAAYDPHSKTIYCLSGGPVLYAFDLAKGTWQSRPAAAELDGLSWHAMACDTIGRRLVVVGADKRADRLGWTRTVVYDIASAKWSRLDVANEKVAREHRELVAAKEAAIDLAGRIRLAWYRDPDGTGTEAELKALSERCDALRKMPRMDGFSAAIGGVAELLDGRKTLDALRSARSLVRGIEELAEARYPVPCSRRNSPLAFDEKNKVFVLFGGDHEDYLMNDTWVLDLAKQSWRRAKPDKAPSPRAGHALCGLGKAGRVALYEGYVQSSNSDYSAAPYSPLDPLQLWLYDAKADRWELAASRPLPAKEDPTTPAPVGFFDGYASERFNPPALAADADGRLVLAAHACGPWYWKWKRPSQTWAFAVDPARADAAGRERLGTAASQRLYRRDPFLASYGEVPDRPRDTALDRLPANRWVRLPDPPRNPCRGCRQRDWGTGVWDSDRDQVLLWGGGHCVRSASTVAHYSPVSGRTVEGFDADEPYSANGGGGFDSSVLNRPWVSTHNYNHYAYDPKCGLMVSARGYLYDPGRMDWLRMEPIAAPFAFAWHETVVETSPHGAVAWARRKGTEQFGLWLFDRDKGWIDLMPKGKLFAPYCDANGMVYDAKRDRMILSGVAGGYEKLSSGALLAFSFKTGALETIVPENAALAKTRNAREMAYLDHADWVLIGELYVPGDQKTGKRYTRVYDCASSRMFLLDAGDVPDGHSTGWMYDPKRKLVYVFTHTGNAFALRAEPGTARLLALRHELGETIEAIAKTSPAKAR
jgi:hypothetical protein